MYTVNFRKNIYLTISIAVSLLLFLAAALYMDFQYANYEQSSERVQKNYIVVRAHDQKNLELLKDAIGRYNYILQYHGSANGHISNGNIESEVFFNLIAGKSFFSGIYVESEIEDTDISNSYGYEKYTLLYGRDTFTSQYEVVISESYARLLYENPEDIVGKQIVMGIDGPSQLFTVVGVYESILTESRINKASLKQILNGESPEDGLYYTAFVPEEWLEVYDSVESSIYIFFKNTAERNEIISVIDNLNNASSGDAEQQFGMLTPSDVKTELKLRYSSVTVTKALLMLVVAVISGISVFGTMQNSILDRKKEIGIKKAVGATDGDIMTSFLIENIFTSLFSMFAAVGLAALISVCVCIYERQIVMIDFAVRIYLNTIIMFACYAFSSVIGFSLIPAYNATQVNIIDIIRDE